MVSLPGDMVSLPGDMVSIPGDDMSSMSGSIAIPKFGKKGKKKGKKKKKKALVPTLNLEMVTLPENVDQLEEQKMGQNEE
jgi:hypothetical protein